MVFFQVWDNMIIESAIKTIYSKDLELMIEAIQRNITVGISSHIIVLVCMLKLFSSQECIYLCSNVILTFSFCLLVSVGCLVQR